MQSSTRWYQSVAVKSCLIAFVATHIPLLGLIALIVLRPDLLSPWGIFVVALAMTLLATVLVIWVLWHMFRPLRAAADSLNLFMTRGLSFQGAGHGSDEIGRMIGVLVRALAHLDRSRSQLFINSAAAVRDAVPGGGDGSRKDRWYALLEVDQWADLDTHASLDELMAVQKAVGEAIDTRLEPGEFCLSWGRARFLIELKTSGATAMDRLAPVCREILANDQVYTATAALEPKGPGTRSRAAALQRLEHKLYELRLNGGQALVA